MPWVALESVRVTKPHRFSCVGCGCRLLEWVVDGTWGEGGLRGAGIVRHGLIMFAQHR